MNREDIAPIPLAPMAVLTSCERAFGGYLIRWEASTRLWWEVALAKVKELPGRMRQYDAATRVWWIDEHAMPWLREAFANFDDALQGTVGTMHQDQPPRPSPQISRAFRALSLLPSAPPVAVKAVYRALKKQGDASLVVRNVDMANLDRAYLLAMTWAENQANQIAA